MKEKIRSLFEEQINRWQLTVDGDPIITPGARLLPVRYNDKVVFYNGFSHGAVSPQHG